MVCYDARDAMRSRRKLLSVLFAVVVFCPMLPAGTAQVSNRPADPLAPTHGFKSAEEIDREWRVSVAKYDAKRDSLIADAERQSHDGPYRPDWETLRNYEIPQWYKDAKFGIFITWGVYAVPGAVNEWYPHNMYRPGEPAYEHFQKNYGSLENLGYKEFISKFRAEKWNPADWVDLFKRAGAKYVIPVAEHHDGFSMYDCSLSDWTAVTMGPHRDIVGVLATAVRAAGLHFGLSSHRAEHNYYFGEGRYIRSDVNDPKYASFYGPAHPWMNDPHFIAYNEWSWVSEAWTRDWLARAVELAEKYKPEVFYFDGGVGHPAFRRSVTEFAAFYYNYAARNNFPAVINFKDYSMQADSGSRDHERALLPGIEAKHWQTDTPISNLSWGYMENDQLKSADFLIHQLVDIVSKNGNLLLNIGPRPDGTIPDEVRATLLEIGAWLDKNGEAIYGTHPWKVFGEGPTQIQTGFGHDADTKPYTASDFRFTAKGPYVYAISMACPADGTASIHSLGTGPQGMGYQTFNLSLLGSSDKLDWVQDDSELDIKLPKSYDCRHGFALRLPIPGVPVN
jgi:alpha-L-fucosidase